ncbi:alpha/beta hydrolase [Vibrio mangrovi]|uniref:Acetylxylan esterase n=1 Tax=Vibrio mangrovi TaxID=474394 RepID=A0A1Y6IRC2_9VIBR|nr:alpha/beta hydrolase [Vibrio mangrovi]MDW6001789.1 alpha/beta hydrolase [Vibrio mangrovi]SMS00185.1 Acetylxylan esterase precursor [Vibrio mangrovi]
MNETPQTPLQTLRQLETSCTVQPIWPVTLPPGTCPPEVTERTLSPDIPDRIITGVQNPECMVFHPETPNGIGVVVFPGGGYMKLAIDNEGIAVAKTLVTMGYTVFVCSYRFPGEGHEFGSDTPLADAQRAIRWVRHHAEQWSLRYVGIMGFSAGGHLSGQLLTRYSETFGTTTDEIDQHSARPDFAALIYPVVSMREDNRHQGTMERLLGNVPTQEQIDRYSVEYHIHTDVPPCFLLHAADDDAVSVNNSLLLWQALRNHHIPVDMHLFGQGKHGFGINKAKHLPAGEWPQLFHRWLTCQKLSGKYAPN